MRKAGISLVALVITIIALVILTGAVVITGMNVTGQAQLAVFYNNVTNIQDAVTMKMTSNMIQYGNTGKIEKYKWVGIVPDYTAEMAEGEGNYPTFGDIVINGENTVALSSEIKASMNISETEANNYRVGKSGTVYHTGYVYEGNTYYNRELVATGTKPVLTGVSALSDGTYHEDKGVNSPKLLPGMVAVYWDNSGKEIRSDGVGNNGETFNYDNWYNYVAQETGVDRTSHWANAITTADGSYWVWIPRYAYSITSGYQGTGLTYVDNKTTEAGTIDIKFLKGASNIASDNTTQWDNELGANKWNIHPAFYYDGDSETGTQLTGIWVAKYEMSAEVKNGENWVSTPVGLWWNGGYNQTPDNLLNTTNMLTTAEIRAVSKPGVSAWRNIDNSTVFANALSYDSGIGNAGLDSHMMKNSEWGAVAYLTHSKYGRNKTEVSMNGSGKFITGWEGSRTRATTTTIDDTERDRYKTTDGQLASSTGNIYGIYDLSGGACEMIAAYVDNGNPNLQANNKNLVSNRNTGYVDVYTAGETTGDNNVKRNANYKATKEAGIYGDALIETSLAEGDTAGTGYRSWYSDYSAFPVASVLAFDRGGSFNDSSIAGVFNFSGSGGGAYASYGWRVALR